MTRAAKKPRPCRVRELGRIRRRSGSLVPYSRSRTLVLESIQRIPRRLEAALAYHDLTSMRVLDLGCGKGAYLRHFGPGSVGLELNEGERQAASRAGLDVRRWDFTEGIPLEFHEKFDAVWCSNLLEHVLHPHPFLIVLRKALRPNGIVIVTVPRTSPIALGPWRGHLAADHVNFFTARTLRLTMEFAGFEIEYVTNTACGGLPRSLGRKMAGLGPVIQVGASPIAGFQYPSKAHKTLDDGAIIFKDA